MADDLRDVILKVRDERRRYGDAKAQLHAMLPPARGPHDIANHLLSYAEEFGVDRTIADVAQDPAQFDMSHLPEGLASVLESVHALSQSLDVLVAARERLLGADDPTRSRAYMLHGREFTIDPAHHQMVFTDTGEAHPVDPELASAPEPSRTKKRRRDRSR